MHTPMCHTNSDRYLVRASERAVRNARLWPLTVIVFDKLIERALRPRQTRRARMMTISLRNNHIKFCRVRSVPVMRLCSHTQRR